MLNETITTIEQLEALYGQAGEASLVKVADRITPEYRAYIEAAPFCALATVGPEGLDCSPRGDVRGFVRVADDKTLLLPDRRGNNRIDSLRNIIRDNRIALMLLVPGSGNIIRVNGRASISIDPALLESFAVNDKAPRSVVILTIEEVYFQCARAILRSDLWNPEKHVANGDLPTPGQILSAMTEDGIDGNAYDAEWSGRASKTMW